MTAKKTGCEPSGSLLTGITLEGKEIVVAKKRGRPVKYRNPTFYDLEKKTEAAALYAVVGHTPTVADKANVPAEVIERWKLEPWWIDIQRKVILENNDGLLCKINNTVELALSMLEDRILNGDAVLIPERIGKSGDIISEETLARVPIKARDLSQIFHALTHQRNLMSGQATQITATAKTTQDRLELLGEQFKAFYKAKEIQGECKVVSEDKEEK